MVFALLPTYLPVQASKIEVDEDDGRRRREPGNSFCLWSRSGIARCVGFRKWLVQGRWRGLALGVPEAVIRDDRDCIRLLLA